MEYKNNHSEIRGAVAKLCAQHPGDYWRELDERHAYPTEFVQVLSDTGFGFRHR